MPDFMQMVATLREQMRADLSRSDVLRVLIWPILALLVGFAIALQAKASTAVLIGFAAFIALFLLLYGVAFVFLLIVDRDALRSEKYTLHKMAIEQGLFGDSSIGLKKIDEKPSDLKAIEANPTLGIDND